MCADRARAAAGSRPPVSQRGAATTRVDLRIDALALAALIGTGLVITAPFFAQHGHWTYLDNPVHVAEAYSLVNSATAGWSDIGFCGFPLSTLHSPFWYGGLASIGRLGLPVEPFFALGLFIGLIAPSIALYLIGRRTISPFIAAILAYLLLVRRGAIIGPAAALAGMWTFHVAAAAFYVLIDRIARRERSLTDVAINGALIGFLGLTHLFSLIALALLAIIHSIRSILSRDRAGRLPYDVLAMVLGALASARYWLGAWFDTSWTPIPVHNRSAEFVLESLLLSPPLDGLPVSWRALLRHPMTAVDIATQLLLLGAGVVGIWYLVQRRPGDDRALYGAWLAAAIMVLLIAVLPQTSLAILGPISWRFVYFALQGLTLAALPWLATLNRRWTHPGRGMAIAIAAAAVIIAPAFGRPLWDRLPTEAQLNEVSQLWGWLAAHHTDAWGRTYIQNMDTPHARDNLTPSGVLALTAHRSGVRQVGDYYDIVPFPVVQWTRSDRQILFGERIDQPMKLDRVALGMEMTHTTHLVTSDDLVATLVHVDPRFDAVYHVGRFTVFALRGVSGWAKPQTPGASIDELQYGTGRIRLQVTSRQGHDTLLLKEAFNPQWRVGGADGIVLKPDALGLMVVSNIPAGTHALELRYRPSPLPGSLTLAGWCAILLLGGLATRRAARERTMGVVRAAPAV